MDRPRKKRTLNGQEEKYQSICEVQCNVEHLLPWHRMSLGRHVGMLRGSADQGCELNAVVRNGKRPCEKMSNSFLSHYKEICVLVCSGRRRIDAQEAMKDDEWRICGCIPYGLIIQTCKFDMMMYAICRRGSMKTYRRSCQCLMLLHPAHNEKKLKGLITGSTDYCCHWSVIISFASWSAYSSLGMPVWLLASSYCTMPR